MSSHPQAAVDEDDRARHERCVLGGQEPYRAGNVLGVAEPPKGVFSSIVAVASSGSTSVSRLLT